MLGGPIAAGDGPADSAYNLDAGVCLTLADSSALAAIDGQHDARNELRLV